MIIEETWGVPIEKANCFFLSHAEAVPQEGGYSYQSCRITLNALDPGLLGKISFPRTLLRIEGPEPEVKSIHRRFLIQFLSAGG